MIWSGIENISLFKIWKISKKTILLTKRFITTPIHEQLRKFIPKGKSLNKLNQEMCDLISLVINAKTYLQNPSKYKLGYIINKQELENIMN